MLSSLFEREPIVYLTLVGACINIGVAFGLTLSPEQETAILGLTVAVLALLGRAVVTPVSKGGA